MSTAATAFELCPGVPGSRDVQQAPEQLMNASPKEQACMSDGAEQPSSCAAGADALPTRAVARQPPDLLEVGPVVGRRFSALIRLHTIGERAPRAAWQIAAALLGLVCSRLVAKSKRTRPVGRTLTACRRASRKAHGMRQTDTRSCSLARTYLVTLGTSYGDLQLCHASASGTPHTRRTREDTRTSGR